MIYRRKRFYQDLEGKNWKIYFIWWVSRHRKHNCKYIYEETLERKKYFCTAMYKFITEVLWAIIQYIPRSSILEKSHFGVKVLLRVNGRKVEAASYITAVARVSGMMDGIRKGGKKDVLHRGLDTRNSRGYRVEGIFLLRNLSLPRVEYKGI